jgi:insertion element IS1 protein InsB
VEHVETYGYVTPGFAGSLTGKMGTRPYWGAYTRHLTPEEHTPGKRNTQKIERKHLTLRTRIKRLVRKTICFSKSTQMHDIVLGLFVNRYAFGRAV